MTGLRAAVLLASAGRPALLEEVIGDLARQTQPIAVRILSVPDERSLPETVPDGWEVVLGTRGLAAQRNAALDRLGDRADAVFFFDDDAVPHDDYVESALRLFRARPAVVGLTGRVLLDGATHGEISRAAAETALSRALDEPRTGAWEPSRELYGCNFAFRRDLVGDIAFDTRLPLYSWLEDHDFARRLMRHGTLARADDCVIVHRGAASGGRTNHVRLGYSQFMNPVYLNRKGSFPVWLMLREIFPRFAKNTAYSLAGGQRAWRRERLRGNLLAASDAVRGRITPERILDL